ncbi:hypothetical protein SAMN04488065_0750 [Haloplanus vescus]|uniref:DUF1772 domain-containing protein n=1 Tax=Haloplanus vescus TaxID=555874 RepID=A0A1H3WD46_9EURY|nr:hypothetical protein [Haloplanus vescus]SDZ84751.1 hypothetical protein SAMN04488065_0750 [Haloplanus vescus]
MVAVANTLRLLGTALGTLGGALVFVEFFQYPSYVQYSPEFQDYRLDASDAGIREHTWLGRIGGLCVSLGFALLFVATFLGR